MADVLELWIYQEATHTVLGTLNTVEDMCVTTRYGDPGEIEMNLPVNPDLILAPGMLVWVKGETEAYVIESTVLQETEDGEFLEVRGRTASALLGRRALFEKKHYTGTGASIIKKMMDATFSAEKRKFPKFYYTIDTTLGSRIDYDYETTAMTLMDAVIAVCKATGIGFRCAFNKYTRDLTFSIYEGKDRTANTADSPAISFDAELGNIQKMSYTQSVEDKATVAYVLGEVGSSGVRKSLEYDPDLLTGYARFEVALESGKSQTTENKDADGNYIKLSAAQYDKLLRDYGMEKLADRDEARTTEGDLLATSQLFVLGVDYNVGDIVNVKNKRWGISDTSRITELVKSYSRGFLELSLTVGSKLPTLLEKMTRVGA